MIIDGHKIAQEILSDLKKKIAAQHLRLGLAAILVGADPALKKFVDLKKKAAQAIGIQFSSYEVGDDASQEQIEESIRWLSQDDGVQGILVELPVPKQFDVQHLLDTIAPEKDVDVLTTQKEGEFYKNISDILPPAVLALKIVCEKQAITLPGKKVAVFGQGRLVGKPIAYWLKNQGAQVSVIDEHTPNPEVYSQQADMIITGVGKPDLITEAMVKQDAIVIDYGYGRKGGVMTGDVASEVAAKASLITPVPGGMGPIVIAAVLQNLLLLSQTAG